MALKIEGTSKVASCGASKLSRYSLNLRANFSSGQNQQCR